MPTTETGEITLNGKTYVEKSKATTAPISTDHIIVIAQRGWIFIGHRNKDVTDKIQLLDSYVVRSWNNGKGIGGLVKNKAGYTLDAAGQIEFPNEAIIAVLLCEW